MVSLWCYCGYYDDITVEVMTTSEDGYVKWWDLRNLQHPTLQWRLQDLNKQGGQVLRVIRADPAVISDL